MPSENKPEETAPKLKRRPWRYVFVTLVLVIAVAIAAPTIYLYRAGGLKGIIELRLSDSLGGAPVTVGDVDFEWRMPSMHLTLLAYEVALSLDDSNVVVPEARAVFEPGALLRFAPSEVRFSGVELDLTIGKKGASFLPAGFLAVLAGSSTKDGTKIERSRHLRVDSSSFTLRSRDPGLAPLSFGEVELEVMTEADGTFVASFDGRRIPEKGPGGRIVVAAIGDAGSMDMRLDVKVDNFRLSTLSPFLQQLPASLSDIGSTSGNAKVMLAAGKIVAADINMVAMGGKLDLNLTGLPVLEYDTASAIIEYKSATGSLVLAQGELALADGRTLALSGDVKALHGPTPQLAFRFRGNRWPIKQIYANWPSGLADDVREGLQKRVSGGDLADFTIEVTGGIDRARSQLQIVSLDLRSLLRNVLLDLGAGQYERLVGLANGSIDFGLGAGGVVETLSVAVGVGEGNLTLADAETPLPFSRFQVTASLQGDIFRLEDISLALADGGSVGVTGDLALGDGWKVNAADIKVVAGAIDLRRFHRLWPEWLISGTRYWVDQKMLKGRVEDVRLKVQSRFDGEKPRIRNLEGSVTLSDARLELGSKIPAFTDLNGRLTIADNIGEIILTEGRVEGLDLSTGRVTIDPVINGKPSRGVTDLKLSGNVGDAIRVASQLGIGGSSGLDLTRIVASGSADITVRTVFPIRRKLKPQAIEFDLEAIVRNGVFTNLPLSADVRKAEFLVSASRKHFEVRGDARVFGLPSKLVFRSLPKENGGEATLDVITASSDLERVVEVAGSLGINGFAGIELSSLAIDGIADLTVRTRFPTGQKLTRSDVSVDTDIIIQQGQLSKLPIFGNASDVDLVGRFSDSGIELSGTANLFGSPVDFVVTEDRLKDKLVFRANAPKAEGLAALIASTTGLDMKGSLGGNIMMVTGSALSDFEIELSLDLAHTSIEIPAIGWAKLPAEPGRASMRLILKDGVPLAIEDIDIEAGSLAMVGRAGFTAPQGNGVAILEASFRRLGWPGNDIGMLELSRDVDGDWLITAEAKLIDLVPLRRNLGIGKGRPVSFDILAEKIILGDGLSLSGHISGNKKAVGGGKASFSGNLSRRTRTLISEGEFQMSFGSGGEFLNGVGIVGGAETTLTYSAAEGEVPELTMSSENGGGTLGGLTVTDTIRSGEMFLRTKFIEGFENFDTNIRITNFTVVEAPRAVRAFSILAPAGLYSLVEGQGTSFNWGEASIEKRGPTINLTQVTGQGQAVSVAFVGQYDDETREVDVSGNLVPASFLSQIIGGIPIVGEILTGVDNAGLFVTQFSLTGSIDDPDASITPASIVPGVLRDLFSPSWLRREGDRILGPIANEGSENGG